MAKVLLTGSSGFLAKKFISQHKNKLKIKKLPKATINNKLNKFYLNTRKIFNFINEFKPKVVIHYAGLRKADCEKNKIFTKKSIVDLTKNIALACKKNNVKFIYISTDHVFDGAGKNYVEGNTKNLKPQTTLGKNKVKAEAVVRKICDDWIIIRPSAIMDDPRLISFVNEKIQNNEELNLFTNIFFSPVLSKDLNRMIIKILRKNIKNRILHCSGTLRLNKYDFYKKVFGNLKLFKPQKCTLSKMHPKDLSLSNSLACKLLDFDFTPFNRSINILLKEK